MCARGAYGLLTQDTRPQWSAWRRRRAKQPFERTGDLVETIKHAIPSPARFGEGHPAKRVFQALRIEVNDELGSLERALPAALEILRPTAGSA